MLNNEKPFTQRQLNDIIKECMGLKEEDSVPALVTKQIARFALQDEMSYKEIGRCVWYYVNIKKKKIEPLYGIGFVSALRNESDTYWSNRERRENERKQEAQIIVNTQKQECHSVVFNIHEIIKHKKQPTQLKPLDFNIKEDNNDGHR